jgi:hypothetical protein
MRWLPRSEDDLARGLKEGLLRESHYVDLKREPDPGKAVNKAMAVDMASLAVDGGILVYGADEQSGELNPFDFSGFRERVDQVARSLVDEPLSVRIELFGSTTDPDKGYAIVIVPESPSAPHMVEGRYRGRGDTTNIVLSDAEVVRLHERRRESRRSIEDLVRAEIERDPSPPQHRTQAHMFVVAEPVSSRPEMLLEAIGDANPTRWIFEKVIHGEASVALTDQWSPDFGAVSTVSRASDGWSAHSGYIAPGRQPTQEAKEGDYFEVELRENGGVRLFCSRASVPHPREDAMGRVAFETLIGGLTLRAVLIADVISKECGHYGAWNLGLAVTNLKGAVSWRATQSFGAYAVPFSADGYVETARVTGEEIDGDPVQVASRLFGRLNRALNGGAVPLPTPR